VAARTNGLAVKLRLTRPDLAVRRGFHPGTIITTGADLRFTTRAINFYAADPDRRSSIGTPEGLTHLIS
jgi:hypothetical protein